MKSNSKKRKLDSSGSASASIAKSKKKSGKGWAKKNIWRRKRNGHEVKTQGVEKASENKFQPLKLLGSKGFLFTCDPHRQREAVREAYNVLNEYADEYFPQPVPEVSPTNDKGEEKSIAELLSEEIAVLKSRKYRRFYKTDSGATGLILIMCADEELNPVELCVKICQDMQTKKVQKSRFLVRLMPYQVCCNVTDGDLMNHLKPLLSGVLDSSAAPTSFAVVYKRRNHDISLRNSICKLAQLVDEKHKTQLKAPSVAINLSVIKGRAFLSVVPKYASLQGLNLRKLVEKK